MIYQERKSECRPSLRMARRKSVAKRPPVWRQLIQCLFFSAEDVEKLRGVEESRRRAIAGFMRQLELNERDIEHARLFGKYSGDVRKKLLRERLELLEQTELLMLGIPLDLLAEHSEESKRLSDWFGQLYDERAGLTEWCTENDAVEERTEFLSTCFTPFDMNFRLKNAWSFLHRWFPEDIEAFEALPGDFRKSYQVFSPEHIPFSRKNEARPDRKERVPERMAAFYTAAVSSSTVSDFSEPGKWQLMPNYLYLYWDVLRILKKEGKLPEVSLSSGLSSLRGKLLRFSSLDLQTNPFYATKWRQDQDYSSEESMNTKVKEEWLAMPFSPLLLEDRPAADFEKLAKGNLMTEEEFKEALEKAKRPFLMESSGDALQFAWDKNRFLNSLYITSRIAEGELARLFFMCRFFSLTAEHSLVFPWKYVPAKSKFFGEFNKEIKYKEISNEEKMREEAGLPERFLRGWELQQAWNSRHRKASSRGSVMGHSFYAFNEWKKRALVSPFTEEEGAGMLFGKLSEDLSIYSLKDRYEEQELSESPSYWEALGESIMQSALLGNWVEAASAVDGRPAYGSMGKSSVFSSSLQVRFSNRKNRIHLVHQWPTMSLEGYGQFAGYSLGKAPYTDEYTIFLKRELKEHLLNLVTVFQNARISLPNDRLSLEFRWFSHYENFMHMLNGMHQVLLNICRNYRDCEKLALEYRRFFPSAPYSIFLELLATVPKVMEEVGYYRSFDALRERRELLKNRLLSHAPLEVVRIRHGRGMEGLYPSGRTIFYPVESHGLRDLLVIGTLSSGDLPRLRELADVERIHRLVLLRPSLGVQALLPEVVGQFCKKKHISVYKEDDRGYLILVQE
ncbi:MAG: hypothetical protein MI784_00940 [Cytophagales bacterium]|nr:hypothetical protein [Cytophagales bacterium]